MLFHVTINKKIGSQNKKFVFGQIFDWTTRCCGHILCHTNSLTIWLSFFHCRFLHTHQYRVLNCFMTIELNWIKYKIVHFTRSSKDEYTYTIAKQKQNLVHFLSFNTIYWIQCEQLSICVVCNAYKLTKEKINKR